MRSTLCLLLLTWGCAAAPSYPKVSRSYSTEEVDINESVDETRTILSKVSSFLKKISDLTSDGESMTPDQAMTILPDFVAEAVKLRDELDSNPVKEEDVAAVQRVKDMVMSSLHTFAQRYDAQGTKLEQTTTTSTTQEPDPPAQATELPLAATETPTEEDSELETATVLSPVEIEETQDYQPEKEELSEETLKKSSPVVAHRFRPTTVPARISHPFSNHQAFSFSNPINNFVQGPEPVIQMLPGGGYYVYYNQGK